MQPSLKKFVFGLFFFTLTLTMAAQTPIKSYTKEWKKIEELAFEKGQSKTAIAELKKLYSLAKKEKQEAQVIKALIYITSLQADTREENELLAIKDYEKELKGASPTSQAILHSIIGNLYWNYFEENRWTLLYNRSQILSVKKDDPATWSITDFHKKIASEYKTSLKEKSLLQKTKLEPYKALLSAGNTRQLRPTLYDLLAHRALEYFSSDESDLNRPTESFEIATASAFDPAADFINYKFDTRDSLSLRRQALLIYQEILRFHLTDAKPDALIDADINRLQFVHQNSTHPEAETLYRAGLNHIAHQYGQYPAAAQAGYLLAFELRQEGLSNDFDLDTSFKGNQIKALEICNQILKSKDSSEGWINAYNLRQEILQPELSFQIENVNIPNQPFRVFMSYRNIPKLHLRLVALDRQQLSQLDTLENEKFWSFLLKQNILRTWQQEIPLPEDYLSHSTEIPVNGLPVGTYFLLASSGSKFGEKDVLGARLFHVSNISFIQNDQEFFVLHRESGQPLTGAQIQVWNQVYDYQKRKYTRTEGKIYRADKYGYFKIETKKSNDPQNSGPRENFKLDISWSSDTLFLDEWMSGRYYYRGSEPEPFQDPVNQRQLFFFTDRGIYRPGQAVYFKAIGIIPDKEKKFIPLNGYKHIIQLRNANDDIIDSLELKSNEYGSIWGSFVLPRTGLNGRFSLHDKEGRSSQYFSVEEYKRPKFSVDFEPLKGSYKVNDTLRITGIAKAFAGNALNDAQVKYRVVREANYPYPWLYRKSWLPPSTPKEIAHGELKTDAEGKFQVEFAAIPDKKSDPKLEPVFTYTVYAEVTDPNGETHEAEKSISAGYKALVLNLGLPEEVSLQKFKSMLVSTENRSGTFEPARIDVRFTTLEPEKRLLRNRYWEKPELQILSKEEYIKLFPHDIYAEEEAMENWTEGKTIWEKSQPSNAESNFDIGNAPFEPGYYKVEVTATNEKGEAVKDIRYLELYAEKNPIPNRPLYGSSVATSTTEPGQKARIEFLTTVDSIFLVEQNNQPDKEGFRFYQIDKTKTDFEFPVREEDRGGFGVIQFFVKNNRFHAFQKSIDVPWSNKELQVELTSFRDKTLPGSEESWKLKISGTKKEKLAAEVLAGMYDASLDEFTDQVWRQPNIWPYRWMPNNWSSRENFSTAYATIKENPLDLLTTTKEYEKLNMGTGVETVKIQYVSLSISARTDEDDMVDAPLPPMQYTKSEANGFAVLSDTTAINDILNLTTKRQDPEPQIRKNLQETAFFFPDLRTDSSGAIEFSFTTPEALTRWKFQALAHTADLGFGYKMQEIVTQKPLMVQPNPPRFLREGDKMEFSSKVVNLTDKEITGQAQLLLFDPTTNQSIDGWFQNMFPNQYFTVGANSSVVVKFPIEVPFLFGKALTWRIVASSSATDSLPMGAFSDGEENALPVLTNRMLVTESLPLSSNGTGTKEYRFEKLLNAGQSESLQSQGITIEYTSNPVWYAIQSLPYLMEYPYECAEQTWNRYYANSLAARIANSSPRIRTLFEAWKKDSTAILSKLQKNEELKVILLEETPWVLEARNEAEQQKKIAQLFDLVRLGEEANASLRKLEQLQSPNGGFVWFQGGPDNRYITQYIVSGIGHLLKLQAGVPEKDRLQSILKKAIPYLDLKIKEDFDRLKKQKANLQQNQLGWTQIQYLYGRSFFPEIIIPAASQPAFKFYQEQARKFWVKQGKYAQGMIALALHRSLDKTTPAQILRSLTETSIQHPELGRYWKLNTGWYWYESNIETQALLIEAFSEIGTNITLVNELKTWLLKNKQTNSWPTTKATAEACYALLLRGEDWASNPQQVRIDLGPIAVQSDQSAEAGTGYLKKSVEGRMVQPEMGNIRVTVKTENGSGTGSPSWGSVYWQYFEDLDKITPAATPLKLEKKLFIKKNTNSGPVLEPVGDGQLIQVGDRITVRIELRVDRDMEYVHMKDMRASSFEPLNVFSGYRWQGGLGYYETTRDASTNFFFDYLRKGTYVFEYDLFANQKGEFSNGITSIQCMYAPEFSAHSEGLRVIIE